MLLRVSAAVVATAVCLSAQISHTHLSTVQTANQRGEIGAFDAASRRFFVTNPGNSTLTVFTVSATGGLSFATSIPLAGSPNSVAVKNGLVAVAVEGTTPQDLGAVQFFDAATGLANGPAVTVGALPDMLAFTPDGTKVLTANEGEADLATGLINPEGSVSIVDVVARTASTASFGPWNGQKAALQAQGVRLSDRFGVTLAQDVEPEYLTIDATSSTAYVTMQEANAFAIVDIATATVTSILPLGDKDHALPINQFDPSNNDGIVGNFQNFPVRGLYMPDAICSFTVGGVTYLATANEGDSRADFAGWDDETRGAALDNDFSLDIEDATPDTGLYTSLQLNTNSILGRLNFVTSDYDLARGDTDGDGDVDQLYCFGGRSFTIWTTAGAIVFDSGAQLEQVMLAEGLLDDSRSDDKGPEPEAVTFGIVGGTPLLFVGLERCNAVVVYDVTNPAAPVLVDVINVLASSGLGSFAPEGLQFLAADQNPTGRALIAVVSEGNGTLSLFAIDNGTAAVTSFGTGCPSVLPLTLASNLPRLGTTWTLAASNVDANAPFAAFWFGTQALPSGIDLTAIGGAGCFAHIDPSLGVGYAAANAGASSYPVVVPAAPSLLAFTLTTQASTFDGALFRSSNALAAVVGN